MAFLENINFTSKYVKKSYLNKDKVVVVVVSIVVTHNYIGRAQLVVQRSKKKLEKQFNSLYR